MIKEKPLMSSIKSTKQNSKTLPQSGTTSNQVFPFVRKALIDSKGKMGSFNYSKKSLSSSRKKETQLPTIPRIIKKKQ